MAPRLALLLVISLLVVACGGAASPTAVPKAAEPTKPAAPATTIAPTARSATGPRTGGVLRLGQAAADIGALDPATGRLAVEGRSGDLIISGGENVWPAAVEAILTELPSVAEAAVVGRPDPEWGQRVVAVVVPVDPSAPPTLDELRDAVKERLGPWAAPKALELVTSLPRTSIGKIRRDAV